MFVVPYEVSILFSCPCLISFGTWWVLTSAYMFISLSFFSTFLALFFYYFLGGSEAETQHACVWCPSEAGGGNDSGPAALHSSVCVCNITYSVCVCVCVLMVHLGSVCRYSSPAHSFISPPAVTVGPRNVRCSKRCGGKCSLTHFCHLMWFVKNQLTYLVCFEDSTANHTHTHTLSLPLHRSFIHHSVWSLLEC